MRREGISEYTRAALLYAFVLICLFPSEPRAADGEDRPSPVGQLFDYGNGAAIPLKDDQDRWALVAGVSVDPPTIDPDSPVKMGVIDSGVALDHPQLAGLVVDHQDFTGEGIDDEIGHGTIVAILTRAGAGDVAFPTFVAKVANADGSIAYESVIEAVDWITQQGATLVNMSLGFRQDEGDYSELCYLMQSKSDTLFVLATGNFGPDVRTMPANCEIDNAICVMAADETGQIADYSSLFREENGILAPGSTQIYRE